MRTAHLISNAPARGPRQGRGWRRLFGCGRGATAVEFGLVAPVFLVMMLGIFELGRAMWIKATLQFAVEEAARYAIVNTSATTTTVATEAQNTCTGTGMSTNVCNGAFAASQDTTGGKTFVSITASYNFQVIAGIVPFPDVTLSARSRVPLM